MAEEPSGDPPLGVAPPAEPARLSIGEFLRLPREFGWIYRYVDGRLVRIPQIIPIPVRRATARAPEASLAGIREPGPGEVAVLADLYRQAFAGNRGYFGWTEDEVAEDAWHSVESFFQGERGEPDPASRVAPAPGGVAGAALVVRHSGVPTLYLLFVSPARRRRGTARALLGEVLRALHARGESFLRSAFDGGDATACAWYRKVGFAEEPSLPVALARVAWLRGEVERGVLGEEARARCRQELHELSGALRSLAEAARMNGPQAVYPDLTVWQRRWWPTRLRRG